MLKLTYKDPIESIIDYGLICARINNISETDLEILKLSLYKSYDLTIRSHTLYEFFSICYEKMQNDNEWTKSKSYNMTKLAKEIFSSCVRADTMNRMVFFLEDKED